MVYAILIKSLEKIAPHGFEPWSRGPEPLMLGRYTTGLNKISPVPYPGRRRSPDLNRDVQGTPAFEAGAIPGYATAALCPNRDLNPGLRLSMARTIVPVSRGRDDWPDYTIGAFLSPNRGLKAA
jgi:hypothetical protein